MECKIRKAVRIIYILIFCSSFNLVFSQTIIPGNYEKIPDTLYFKDRLYKSIIPNEKYKYWKFIKKDALTEKLIYENKKKENISNKEKHSIEDGFFWECLPDGCFTYIIAYKSKQPEYFINEKELIKFIGYVDNLSEALLIARTHDLWFDRKNLIGGSFKIEKDFIYLYLAKSESCPVNRTAFFVKINRKTGELEKENKGVYYKSEDCYTS
ncbi:hypothetical protein QWZ06_01585 [Chryseobacterium tructae]|uniref:Uncharacterized protein n=1 Tax=Chryseobacterium tructae TaxID=1037380 RepID=A0ABV7XTX7_9FLAO|nr:hypothetical protein [Chryseobacterium tructae]MDN3691051.1 hypothetical protein [Chryseobacterium tructae]